MEIKIDLRTVLRCNSKKDQFFEITLEKKGELLDSEFFNV